MHGYLRLNLNLGGVVVVVVDCVCFDSLLMRAIVVAGVEGLLVGVFCLGWCCLYDVQSCLRH